MAVLVLRADSSRCPGPSHLRARGCAPGSTSSGHVQVQSGLLRGAPISESGFARMSDGARYRRQRFAALCASRANTSLRRINELRPRQLRERRLAVRRFDDDRAVEHRLGRPRPPCSRTGTPRIRGGLLSRTVTVARTRSPTRMTPLNSSCCETMRRTGAWQPALEACRKDDGLRGHRLDAQVARLDRDAFTRLNGTTSPDTSSSASISVWPTTRARRLPVAPISISSNVTLL